jgi:hypothetical protein
MGLNNQTGHSTGKHMPQNKHKRDAHLTGEGGIIGQPGFRNRAGRSGLDLLETGAEEGHMQGVLIRNLFRLKVRTRNPFYLILMFLFGVIPFPVMIAAAVELLNNSKPVTPDLVMILSIISGIIIFVFLLTVFGALSINFALSILEILGVIPSQKAARAAALKAGGGEKRPAKRRKDYR